jgi:hypothetical protein
LFLYNQLKKEGRRNEIKAHSLLTSNEMLKMVRLSNLTQDFLWFVNLSCFWLFTCYFFTCYFSLVFFCTSGIATEDGGSFCCYQASKRYDSSTESYIKSFLWLEDLNTCLVWILIYNSCLPVTFIHFPSFFDVSCRCQKQK